eukprot:CAMPEP_0116119632 /NCGR_PEP_ID=MMETSP0329-20121206/2746_1 /TAXON_ID=697910 /ORGANISM="Pseudo-nitzschia arenysensis, Strain B593" /LENGTH=365 /DNA_ID=CAMNT_0003613349 /DNA_START=97 /DNA_END=1194 /DNA_ORIENTATION=-
MLDWILDEAELQASEVLDGSDPCSSEACSADPCSSGQRARRIRGRDSDSYSNSSYSYSSSESVESEGNRRRYLQEQARMLTRKIMQKERMMRQQTTEYDADESTVENCSGVSSSGIVSSGASYYFASLNDSIIRTRSILDDNSVSERGQEADENTGANNNSDEENALTEEEENRKRRKLWRIKKKRKRRHYDDEEEGEERTENDHKLDPEELVNQTKLAKKQERKKLIIFTIIVVPLIICGMAGLGVFLALTWNADPIPNESDANSGYVLDSEGPTLRFSPSYDGSDYDIGTTGSSDSSPEVVQLSPEETALPMVDDEVYNKHMEAYERWKLAGGKDDDDDDFSADVDLDEYLDEISFGSGGGDR